jgi:hypothetical protein
MRLGVLKKETRIEIEERRERREGV